MAAPIPDTAPELSPPVVRIPWPLPPAPALVSALMCANLSSIAYSDAATAATQLAALGWTLADSEGRSGFFDIPSTDTQGFVATRTTTSPAGFDVVVAFRGTESLWDIVTDVNFASGSVVFTAATAGGTSPLPAVTGPAGFLRAYRSASAKVLASLDAALAQAPGGVDPVVYVTGHSLGGALATYLATEVAGGALATDVRDVRLFTYGTPPCAGQDLADYFATLLAPSGPLTSYRFTNDGDPIPWVFWFAGALRVWGQCDDPVSLGPSYAYGPYPLSVIDAIITACHPIANYIAHLDFLVHGSPAGGPWGNATAGSAFDDSAFVTQVNNRRIVGLNLRGGTDVNGIEVFYSMPSGRAGDTGDTGMHGGGGTLKSYTLTPGDRVQTIEGTLGPLRAGQRSLASLALTTATGARFETGTRTDAPFSYTAPPGQTIAAFTGRSDTKRLYQIGVVTQALPAFNYSWISDTRSTGGTPWDDAYLITPSRAIRRIQVMADSEVRSIQTTYVDTITGDLYSGEAHGHLDGKKFLVEFADDEYLTTVAGWSQKVGERDDPTVIGLALTTSAATYAFGTTWAAGADVPSDAVAFSWNVGPTCEVIGFFGRQGTVVDALGALVRPILTGGRVDWEAGWRLCKNCKGLWYAGWGGSACPKDNRQHEAYDLTAYTLAVDSPVASGESGWRWCSKCAGLWRPDAPSGPAAGVCPADLQGHSQEDSDLYTLYTLPTGFLSTYGVQVNWRRCIACQALYQWAIRPSFCPASPTRGDHVSESSTDLLVNYYLRCNGDLC